MVTVNKEALFNVHNMLTTVLSCYKYSVCEIKSTGQRGSWAVSPGLQAQAWYKLRHAEA